MKIKIEMEKEEFIAMFEKREKITIAGEVLGKFTRNNKQCLNDYSWEEIAHIAKIDKAIEYFNVGDTKTLLLGENEEVSVRIAGFNHDDKADGTGKAGITFETVTLLPEERMNEKCSNKGGWEKSKMRMETMYKIWEELPRSLKKHIKPVVKYTSIGDKSGVIGRTEDKLFLFSEKEIFGSDGNSSGFFSVPGEGQQYELFKGKEERDTLFCKRGNSAGAWWLRSPLSGSSTYFCRVFSDGSANSGGASNTRGVCFGFCI